MGNWDGYYNGNDWEAMNERLKNSSNEPSYHRPDPKPVRSRLAGRMPNYFNKIMKLPEPTRESAQKCLPRDIQVIDASRHFVTTERPNDTLAERLTMRIGKNYVTVVRYDQDDSHCIVDVNGNAQSASMDVIDGIVKNL